MHLSTYIFGASICTFGLLFFGGFPGKAQSVGGQNACSAIIIGDHNVIDLSGCTITSAQVTPETFPGGIVSTRGFDFGFTGCNALNTDELICSFLVRNNQQPRNLRLWSSKSRAIIGGNVLVPAAVQLGYMGTLAGGGRISEMENLPTQVILRGKALFRIRNGSMIPESEINVDYIEFGFSDFSIWFRPEA